ncbi:MAG: thiamine phosphate synthase [Planctomycetota bacterium]
MNAHRLIDANANRAREALRVMEDGARFLLDDAALCAELKSMRHDLAAALGMLPGAGGIGLVQRDTPGDVGTTIGTPSEYTRATQRDVIVAAGKRCTEALRTIEEFAKTTGPPDVPRRIEALRYRAYDVERRLTLAMGSGRGVQWKLCVLITESLCIHHSWLDVARMAMEGGADCIQLREKELDGRALVERAEELVRHRGEDSRVSIIVNDRVDVALAAGADGVHLGQGDLSVADARRMAGFDLLIGVSTSNLDEARQALRDGADSCGVGAMYPTTTKHKDTTAGVAYLREYLAHDPPLPPHLAIGGITPEHIGELRAAGAQGVAVSSCVCGAKDPAAVCQALLHAE